MIRRDSLGRYHIHHAHLQISEVVDAPNWLVSLRLPLSVFG
jgi:acetamidase/formamidase